MSDHPASAARPVSLFTIVFVMVLFAAFLLVVRYFYTPAGNAPQNLAPDNLAKDFAWRADAEARRKTLEEQTRQQREQLEQYAWADQAKGRVQLPIRRAMELTVQQHGGKKQ